MIKNLFAACILYTSLSVAQGFSWIQRVPGTNTDYATSVSSAANGQGFFMSGYFLSTPVTFGTTSMSSAGSSDVFLARYDQNGNILWAKRAGGTGSDYGQSVVTAPGGRAYITGYFYSSPMNVGSTALTPKGYTDIFVAKYDANGYAMWAKSFGGSVYDAGASVATDNNSNLYLTGYFSSPDLTLDTYTLATNGQHDVLLAKLDSNGTVAWAKSVGGTNFEYGTGITTDNSGNVIVTGYFMSSSITFGTTVLNNAGGTNMFVAKYTSSGNLVWAKSFGGAGTDVANSVSVDANGNIYMGGSFSSSSISFGGTVLTNQAVGLPDAYLVKLDPNGNVLWARAAGGTQADYGLSISASSTGNVFMAGYYDSNTLSFGASSVSRDSATASYLAEYDATGQLLCASSFNTNNGPPVAVSEDKAGGAYLVGEFSSYPFVTGTYTLWPSVQYVQTMFVSRYSCANNTIIADHEASSVYVFPNPSETSVSIMSVETIDSMELTDILGNRIKRVTGVTQLDLRDQSPGVYILVIYSGEKRILRKLVKE